MFIKKNPPSAPRSGFSLLELLLVMTLAPVIFFSIYSNFSAGVRIWSKVVGQTPEEDVNIFYDKAGRDFENMMRYDAIPFVGEKEETSFACSIEAPPELGGGRGIGQVRFFYDPRSKTVRREVKDYSQVYKESPGRETVLFEGVSSFELAYLSFSRSDNEAVWSETWKPEPKSLPLAVRLTFSAGQAAQRKEKTFFVPAGGDLK